MIKQPRCWCGNEALELFSDGYLRCGICGTLVAAKMPDSSISDVKDDEKDFYGREYWFSHQEKDLGFQNVEERARLDLPERCLYWLRTLLKYMVPPGKALELGCAHGGFVALLRWTGFDASGLELSPWVVDYARTTFEIPMYKGPIEQQNIAQNSLDIVAMMDVLEHLPDPVGTIRHCASLLKPGGLFLIQTPSFQESMSHAAMLGNDDPFLEQLKAEQHLYLFSRRSVQEFFARLGFAYLEFEPAIFAHYDMFFVASRQPPVHLTEDSVWSALGSSAGGRLVQALLDSDTKRIDQLRQLASARADHLALLEGLEKRDRRLSEAEVLQAELDELRQHFEGSEMDRAARLAVIDQQATKLGEVEAERNILRSQLQDLRWHFENAEADRAARLKVIEEQEVKLGKLDADRRHLQSQLADLKKQLDTSEARLREVEEGMNQLRSQLPVRIARRLHLLK